MTKKTNSISIIIGSLLTAFLLCSCSIYKDMAKPQKGHPAYHDINQAVQNGYAQDKALDAQKTVLPSDINEALLPDLSVDQPDASKRPEPRFNINVNEIPARTFFMGLVAGTKYNMIVSPKIQGTITLNLRRVTIPEVLEAVRDNYGFQFRETSFGYEISPTELDTRIFTLDYLDISRSGQSYITVNSGQISQTPGSSKGGSNSNKSSVLSRDGKDNFNTTSPTSSVSTSSQADFWKQLDESLKLMLGKKEGREVVVNPAAGIVIVRAYPDELQSVEQYLDSIQATLTRQVIIEAKILEIELSDSFQAGIDWSLLGLSQTANQALSNDLGAFTSIFKLDTSFRGAFSTVVELLSTQGNVQVLSSPRIATLNNQKAIIKVGDDQYYVTNISSTTLAGSSTENTQNVDLTPFFSGIALDVTPQIDRNGEIILHIHPMISRVTEQQITYKINDKSQNIPSAKSTIRESDNIVRAENGQVVVIGGLMENLMEEYMGSTPILDKAPVIGPLFRRTKQEARKTELVILLRPVVVGDNTWTKQLRAEAQRTQTFNRGYHFGSHPEVFGNTAEPSNKSIPSKGIK